MPFYDYGEDRFFCSDGAPAEIAARRQAGFAQLSALYKARFAETIRRTEEASEIISDLQFTDAYRAPFQYSRMVGTHLPSAALAQSSNGVTISDLGPFRAARFEVLQTLRLEETTYGWAVEMILKGAVQGFRIVEVPVSYFPRIGKSKIGGTFRGTVGAAWFIFSLIVRYSFRRRNAVATQSA